MRMTGDSNATKTNDDTKMAKVVVMMVGLFERDYKGVETEKSGCMCVSVEVQSIRGTSLINRVVTNRFLNRIDRCYNLPPSLTNFQIGITDN